MKRSEADRSEMAAPGVAHLQYVSFRADAPPVSLRSSLTLVAQCRRRERQASSKRESHNLQELSPPPSQQEAAEEPRCSQTPVCQLR